MEGWQSCVYHIVRDIYGRPGYGEQYLLRCFKSQLVLFLVRLHGRSGVAAHDSDGALRGTENDMSMHFAASQQVALLWSEMACRVL